MSTKFNKKENNLVKNGIYISKKKIITFKFLIFNANTNSTILPDTYDV